MTKLGCLVKKSAHGYASVIPFTMGIAEFVSTPQSRDGMLFRCWFFSFIASLAGLVIMLGDCDFLLFTVLYFVIALVPIILTPLYSAFYDCYIDGDAE